MKAPLEDWGQAFNHPKLNHRHTVKFKAEPLEGHTELWDDGGGGESWLDQLFSGIPGEATEHSWEVPEGVEWVYVFGTGGASQGFYENVFGMFVLPVTSGETLTIVIGDAPTLGVGGLPNGGNAGRLDSGSFYGGGGSTTISSGGDFLFVAPGRGGHVFSGSGGGGGGTGNANWTYWNSDPASWIGASLANPSPVALVSPPSPGSGSITYVLAGQDVGTPGAGMVGGAGSPWTLSGTPEQCGGGGGGGWGGGPGGGVYKTRQVGTDLYWHHCSTGRSGLPFVAADASYAGPPFTERVNGNPFSAPFTTLFAGTGYLYLRWLDPT